MRGRSFASAGIGHLRAWFRFAKRRDSLWPVGWAKALAPLLDEGSLSCAVPTRSCGVANYDGVGTAHESPCHREISCQRLCPPYKTVHCVESKEIRPLFAALGQGVALIPLFRLPRDRGGWRADKALPGLLQAGMIWASSVTPCALR